MLKTACIHPELMKLLSACGHGDKILIADGNYPIESKTDGAELVYLGLTHGVPLVTDVLKVINATVATELAEVMIPSEGPEPSIFKEFHEILDDDIPFESLSRYEFYDECRKPEVRIAISTGEQRVYANILLTVGVV